MKREIATEIEIRASADQVWNILTDLTRYNEWNGFLPKIKGILEVTSKVCFVFNLPPFRAPACAKVLVVEPKKTLRWAGGIPGLLRAEHYHILESTSDSSVRFRHGEIFTGILVPLMWYLFLSRNGPPVYENVNHALKQRAENTH